MIKEALASYNSTNLTSVSSVLSLTDYREKTLIALQLLDEKQLLKEALNYYLRR
ncbi:hypothetical protein [Mucilaginibacter arboris]|uniref:Uncharacterized protein n=1 Tax=Mucilaginibacter arboris TaxID=2682090 RepID=A0A7K1SSF3_9SPHI|nr:hypothetical protein [Mucilaginibacter arboris]MVN20174.1 hypothetical protein [Mucilaginibacter arboris]